VLIVANEDGCHRVAAVLKGAVVGSTSYELVINTVALTVSE
jgi:hypothetical protein